MIVAVIIHVTFHDWPGWAKTLTLVGLLTPIAILIGLLIHKSIQDSIEDRRIWRERKRTGKWRV
jgi:hypothetical protein